MTAEGERPWRGLVRDNERYDLDLGHEHYLRFFQWAPEDLPGNREHFGMPLPNVPRAGGTIRHRARDGSWCLSAINFDLPEMRKWLKPKSLWQVQSWEPLTLSPSILCKAPLADGTECGDHGFIRGGRWIPA